MIMDCRQACQLLARRLILEEEFSPLQQVMPGMAPLLDHVDAAVARLVGGNLELVVMVTVEPGGPTPDDLEVLVDQFRQNVEKIAGRVKGRVICCLLVLTEHGLPTWLEASLKNLPGNSLFSKAQVASTWCSLDGEARVFQRPEPPPSLAWYAGALANPVLPEGREVDQVLLDRQREQRQLRAWLRPGPPWITWGLIASNLGYFMLQNMTVTAFESRGLPAMQAQQAALKMLGINNRLLVFEQGQWWRLIASTFMHAGTLHLVFNMMALYSLGTFYERLAGPLRFLGVYLACGVLAALASCLNPPMVHSLGASGAILGLAGALMTLKWRPLKGFPPEVAERVYASLKGSILFILVVGFSLGLMDNPRLQFDNLAHLGGLVAGSLSMIFFPPRRRGH